MNKRFKTLSIVRYHAFCRSRYPSARGEALLGQAGVRLGASASSAPTDFGHDGGFVGMSSFGASAPYQDLYNHFNITADAALAEVEKRI